MDISSSTLGTAARRQANWPRELTAGLSVACITLPFALAAGVLVYSPLGANFLAQGTVAGLTTSVVAGSSFVITSPNASTAIIPAALATSLMAEPVFAAHPQWIVLPMTLCVLLG